MPNGSDVPVDRLCKAAWEMWRLGDRKLEFGSHLEEELRKPLTEENNKVLRSMEGHKY